MKATAPGKRQNDCVTDLILTLLRVPSTASRFVLASAVPSVVVMSVKLRKLLAATSCWLVVVYGSLDRVAGADHAATVDGILRSVVAVRSQLEPVVKLRLAQRTTALPPVTRMGGLSCGATIRASGLQRLFNCVTMENRPPEVVPTVSQFNVQERTNDTPQYTAVKIISADRKGAWSTNSDGTSSSGQDVAKRPYQEERPSNPLGLIFPTLQQINQFNQWQRPYQSPNQLPAATIPTSTTTITTVRPRGNDFYFPPSGDDRFTAVSTVRPAPYYTTTVPTSVPTGETGTQPSSWAGSDITEHPPEEGTTEPPEEESGLGNRIDSKVLLSLVG
ncbi:uncharacterized protein LOC128717822 [Anopheles marshallii]|uniref:uncharacterized protein LOC128717822 n=1 Tax=Anopheles marshallii TaxID=1521116 RepID=UPI00237BCC83|nr:uncharacterized protein LOC128717822 [Anopheles marshallii]